MQLNDAILAKTGAATVQAGLLAWYQAGGAVSNDLDTAEHQYLMLLVGGTLGAELNPDFDFNTDASWTKGDGWNIAGGKADVVNNAATSLLLLTAGITFTGGLYQVEIYCKQYHAGQFSLAIGAARYDAVHPSEGYNRVYITATGLLLPGIEAGPESHASFESLSIKELTAADTLNHQENDLWEVYLRGLGYTGSLDDMKLAYWSAP